jgi:hypothetical protein
MREQMMNGNGITKLQPTVTVKTQKQKEKEGNVSSNI